MNRQILSCGVLLGVLGLGLPARAGVGSRLEAETSALVKLLDEPIDTKDLKEEVNAGKSFLNSLAEKIAAKGRELPIQIHVEAFKKGTKARSILDGELPFPTPHLPRRMSAGAFLRIMLAQFDDVETTFLIRNGVVEILPTKLATPKYLLQQRVTGSYYQEPLGEVLRTLSYQTGATVVLDSRAGELVKAPITATFHNDVTLEAALRMVSEMAELKLVELADGLFVTTPPHAEILQQENPVHVDPLKNRVSRPAQ